MMFSDARKMWSTATSALAQALENFDEELNKPGEGEQNGSVTLDKALEDLNAYKKLLDDAQMQHFELSKQSRILVAEKDAEIQFLKSKLSKDQNGGADGNSNDANEDELQFQKLLSEKFILESTLQDTEEKLKELIHERNEFQVLQLSYQDILKRYEEIKSDYHTLKVESETKAKQKSETIDNLVSEYSRLAAETELMTARCHQREQTVLKENEILVTKLAALEHSISELADRTVASDRTDRSSTGTPSLPVPPASPATTTPSADTKEADAVILTMQKELKELRNKVVNLQYDVKEKNDVIESLQTQLASATTATPVTSVPSTPNRRATTTTTLSEAEKQEEQEKQKQHEALQAQHEVDEDLIRTLKQQVLQLTDTQTSLQTQYTEAQAQYTKQSNDLITLQQELNTLKLAQTSVSSDVSSALVQAKENEVQAKIKEITALQASIHTINQDHEAKLQAMQAAHSEVLLKEKENMVKLLAEKENQLQTIAQEKEAIAKQFENQLLQQNESTGGQISLLQRELNDTKALFVQEKQSFQAEITLLQTKLSDKETQLSSLLANNGENNEVLQAQVEQITQLQEALQAKKTDCDTVQNEKNSLLAQLQDKEQALTGLQTQLDKQVEEMQEAKVQHAKEIANEKDLAAKALADLQAEKAQVLIQLENKESELQVLQAKVVALEELLQSEQAAAKILLEEMIVKTTKEVTEALTNQHVESTTALQTTHTQALVQLTQEKDTLLDQTVIQLSAKNSEELATQKSTLQATHQVALDQSLASLKTSLTGEFEAKEKILLEQKEQEKSQALTVQEQAFQNEKQALEADFTTKLTSVQGELSVLQSQYNAQETKFQSFLAEQLSLLRAEKDAECNAKLLAQEQQFQGLILAANAERDEHLANYTKERKLRKKIHNKLLEVQGNIRVICRVRPVLEVERKSGEDVDITEIPNDEELVIQRDMQTKTKYDYDRVFGQKSTQEEVFEAVQPLCVSVLDGYNVCIFAYGQTGSGKTFTMEGYGDQYGVSPRAIQELFVQMQGMTEHATYTLTLSMLEIYNETIRDLLDSSKGGNSDNKLDIRQTAEGNTVPGLTEVVITSAEQVRDLMKLGQANRAVGSHDMNEHSSRSHSILTVTARGKNKLDNSTTFGKLHLIDLAGSERVGKTDATGDRLKEAQAINKSLSALGDVVNALGTKKTHIPYRNSKLTFLLQDSLGGNSKVLTFVNISPAVYNLGETVCSLNFASRCRNTELGQAKRQVSSNSNSSSEGGGSEATGPPSVAKQLLRERREAAAASGGLSSSSSRDASFSSSSKSLISPAIRR